MDVGARREISQDGGLVVVPNILISPPPSMWTSLMEAPLCCILESMSACEQTAEAAMQHKQEAMLIHNLQMGIRKFVWARRDESERN